MSIKNVINKMLGNESNSAESKEVKNSTSASPSSGENVDKDSAESDAESNAKPSSSVYNLIILDESGSMIDVRHQTITGCNETLNGIRSIAKEEKEQRQFVSIYCFDTSNPRYIFQNVPIEEVRDLTPEDYNPCACTPLYDAIGNTVSQLRKVANDTYSTGKVTIITDGYENASEKWTHSAVVELIESLKKKGWIFTFMGANIDVEMTSRSLGIDSYMEFEQTDEGMRKMFESERLSQRAYAKKMAYMRASHAFRCASEADREEMMGAMNENYFTDARRVAPGIIDSLGPDEIFVFGSNVRGVHDGGAARLAYERFGAVIGQAEGIQGQSYAIPSVGNTFSELQAAVERFTEYAVMHPKQKFMLTAIGCGQAGYSPYQIAPLFRKAYEFGNVYVPAVFLPYVE